jgi:hypothetical protein
LGASDSWRFGKRRGWVRRTVTAGLDATPLVGDFNGDDRDDILWYRPGPPADRLWIGNRSRRFGQRPVDMGRGYATAAVGDFDGNLKDDIFWADSPNLRNRIWRFR